jgi:hypothetical protein
MHGGCSLGAGTLGARAAAGRRLTPKRPSAFSGTAYRSLEESVALARERRALMYGMPYARYERHREHRERRGRHGRPGSGT